AHIGVLRTLNAHGIWPDIIAGTSIGAVVGGYYAAGRLDIFEHWARQLTRRSLLGYLDFKFGSSGLIGGGRLPNPLDDTLARPSPPRRALAPAPRGSGGGPPPGSGAAPGPSRRWVAPPLCAGGTLPAATDRRPLADGRCARQSAANLGRPRARRPPRHRRQS